MLKKLHAYILKSYIGPLIMTFAIALFILLLQFIWKYINELIGKGLEWSIISELLVYAASGLVPMALPLAILLSSLMLFGNLGEHYELTAMKSAGISLQKIMSPLIVLSIFISILAFLFSNHVLPYTNFKMNMLFYDIRHQRPELNIQPGVFNYDIEGYVLKAKSKNQQTNVLYDILIYDHKNFGRGNTNVTHADSGIMVVTTDKKYMFITLYNGESYLEVKEDEQNKNKFPHRNDKFEKQTVILELTGFDFNRTDESLFRQNYQMMSIAQLNVSSDSLIKEYEYDKARTENTLITVNYFKNARKIGIPKPDTTNISLVENFRPTRDVVFRHEKLNNEQILLNIDSLFNESAPNNKMKMIDWATNYARASKSYIDDSDERLSRKQKEINRYHIAWHQKYSLSFACLIFFFIGAPLGAIIRKGGFGMPVVVSVFIFIIYYIISLTGLKFSRESVVPVWTGMWASSFVLLPLGIWLTYKATTDSGLLSKEAYANFVHKLASIVKVFIKAKQK